MVEASEASEEEKAGSGGTPGEPGPVAELEETTALNRESSGLEGPGGEVGVTPFVHFLQLQPGNAGEEGVCSRAINNQYSFL